MQRIARQAFPPKNRQTNAARIGSPGGTESPRQASPEQAGDAGFQAGDAMLINNRSLIAESAGAGGRYVGISSELKVLKVLKVRRIQ